MDRYKAVIGTGAALIALYFYANSEDSKAEPRILADVAKSNNFSQDQMSKGGVILHIAGIVYLLAAIQVVTSTRLAPLIDAVIAKYSLTSDVSRAFWLGLAGSAPELCICFTGFLLADSAVGLGNVLGAGALNALFLTGLCAILAKTNLELHWWPLARDFIFNSIMLGILSESLYNRRVSILDACLIIGVYLLYLVFMYFNEKVEKVVKKYLNLPYEGDQKEYHPLPERPFPCRRKSITELEPYLPAKLRYEKGVLAKVTRNVYQQQLKFTAEEGASDLLKHFKRAGLVVLRALEEQSRCLVRYKESRGLYQPYQNETHEPENSDERDSLMKLANLHRSMRLLTTVSASRSLFSRISRWMMTPVALSVRLTVPTNPRLWVLGGLMCFAWISGFAYLVVWWSHAISLAFDAHDSLLGMVFLAPGTTFPDLYNIVQATLQGKSEVALSTSVSSNILNIAIGLGLPLFIYTLTWGDFKTDSGALFVASCVQIGMVFVAFLFIGGFKWQLNRSLGKVMFAFYIVYVVIYLVVELALYSDS